jgi:hypothetical protein
MESSSAFWPHGAVENGNVAAVTAWLDGGGHVDAPKNDEGLGWTMLMVASMHGHTALVDLLLARGASVDVQTGGGCTALMIAAVHGHPTIVRRLLRAGARLDLRDMLGRTALQLAAERFNKPKCARWIRFKMAKARRWARVLTLARNTKHAAKQFEYIYEEVTLRPGHQGALAAGADWAARVQEEEAAAAESAAAPADEPTISSRKRVREE